MVLRVTILAVLACPLLAAPANASQLLALNADSASLRVNVRGDALVTFERAGAHSSILARGGPNANQVDSGRPQVEFELDYRAARRARSFRDSCRAYAGR